MKSMDWQSTKLIGNNDAIKSAINYGPRFRYGPLCFDLGKIPDWIWHLSLRFCLFPPRRLWTRFNCVTKALGTMGFSASADATMLLDELYDMGKVPEKKRANTMAAHSFFETSDFSPDLGELMDSPEGVMDNLLQTVSEDEYRILRHLMIPNESPVDTAEAHFSLNTEDTTAFVVFLS